VQQAGLQVQKDERLFSVRPPELLQLQQRWLSHLQKISTPPTPEWTAQSVTLRKALLKNGLSMAQLDSLKKYKRPFRRLFVKVPLRSHVLKRFVKTGQSLKQGQPVVQLADLSVLDVSFSVPIRWWSAIRLGQKVNWTTSALPGQRFEATIAGFGVTVREVVTVRGRLSNPELRLRPGLRLQGVLKLSVNGDGRASKTGVVLKPHEQPMVVPTSAVLWQGKQAYVFVRQVHKVRRTVRYLRRKLEVGGRFQQWVLVLKGLSVGDEVVSRGAGFLDAELSLQQSQLWGQP
jgi:multidrug efflux pump subunit AcrA (membrane-fusion protein)